jgi:hypothetical protein
MNGAFHVQGRLIERHGSAVVRDEARHVDTDSRDEAFRIAAMLHADGFTAWVWAVDPRTTPTTWDLLERMEHPRPARDRRRTPGVRRGTAQQRAWADTV